jgi:hypothetical protein
MLGTTTTETVMSGTVTPGTIMSGTVTPGKMMSGKVTTEIMISETIAGQDKEAVQNLYNNYMLQMQTLINQKAIEPPGAKKPWWRFWSPAEIIP